MNRFDCKSDHNTCFINFETPVEHLDLPSKFTFPFYYEPHPISIIAARELQDYLLKEDDLIHNFGVEDDRGQGKMFGILVVKNHQGELGYLAAFSGKLKGGNQYKHFVPPVFDILDEEGFYRKEESINNAINRKIENLENRKEIKELETEIKRLEALWLLEAKRFKDEINQAKKERDQKRKEGKSLPIAQFEKLQESLNLESSIYNYRLKDLNTHFKKSIANVQQQLDTYLQEIVALKEERKHRSFAIQHQLFSNYTFLNGAGKSKSIVDIFNIQAGHIPPSGAGECAAPKLLQHAFLHGYKPIAMAEFWWGKSPESEIRKHGHYYPACRSKCEPILGHMLQGIAIDDNPITSNHSSYKTVEIVYEDDHLLIINKPPDLLSVPGKQIYESVQSQMKQMFPEATGPLIVHRLDMSTSGIMLIAKNIATHFHLQSQFIKRKIKKTYVAMLDGVVTKESGLIDLPLRVDLDNRPHQLVCFEYGKSAQTRWKVIAYNNGKTLVHFYPITGRTHQLRVHASHPLGLNTPIMGDDLYGKKSDRLYLHAQAIEFLHPSSKEIMRIEVKADFETTNCNK